MVAISNDTPKTDSAAPAPAPLERPKAGFPLTSLALLVTVLACLLACADINRWRIQYAGLSAGGSSQLVILFGGAGIFGGIVGLVYLLRHRSSWRARLAAPFMGVLASETGVLILLAPGAMWRTIFAISILLIAAILLRLDAD